MSYDEIILYDLIKIYERRDAKSSNFKTKIKIKLSKDKYPKYFEDVSGYDEAIERLIKKDYITAKKIPYDTVYESISLNIDKIEEIKKLLNINSISYKRERLINELSKYNDEILINLLKEIMNKINNNKSIKQYLNDDYIDAIKAVHYLENLDHVIYERNASNYIFNDSKRLSSLKNIIASIYQNDNIFQEKGIMSITPYLYIKGQGKIKINEEIIDLSKLNTSIGIPIDDPNSINFEDISKVTTIENLTTFYNYQNDGIIIYLGGFSTRNQIEILKKLKDNCLNFNHFGDIDFGGFSILNNLIEELDININTINMDLNTLILHQKYAQSFNDDNYLIKLKTLLNKEKLKPYYDVINYMIEHKIWLEQESLYNK